MCLSQYRCQLKISRVQRHLVVSPCTRNLAIWDAVQTVELDAYELLCGMVCSSAVHPGSPMSVAAHGVGHAVLAA